MQSENKSQMDGESFLVASRRRVLQYATLLGVGTTSLVKSKSVRAAAADGNNVTFVETTTVNPTVAEISEILE